MTKISTNEGKEDARALGSAYLTGWLSDGVISQISAIGWVAPSPGFQVFLEVKAWSWASSVDVSSSLEKKKQKATMKTENLQLSGTFHQIPHWIWKNWALYTNVGHQSNKWNYRKTVLMQTVETGRVMGALTSLAFSGIFRASSVQFVASERFPSSLWHCESNSRMISVYSPHNPNTLMGWQ